MHARQHHVWLFFIGGILSMLLAGCAANVGKTIKVSDEQLSKYGTLSSADAIAGLEKRVNEAKSAGMPFFAPDYFRGASVILSGLQKSSDKKPKNELINDIAKADALLVKGNAMITVVQGRFADEMALKNQMDKDNVAKVYPKEYEKTIGKLSGLIEKVELEKPDNIDKDKIELLKMMQALDVRAIQYTALHESDVINQDTESNDGEEQAPATLAEAQRIYQDAMNRIAQAPHDEGIVQRAGADAMFAARHARNVSRRVLALQNKYKIPAEPIVLEEEKHLFAISTALGHADTRDRPIEIQAEEIAKAAAEVLQGQQMSSQTSVAVNDQSKVLEERLKQTGDALQQANVHLAEKDAQIKILEEKIALLEEQNNSLVKAKTAKNNTTKTKPMIPAR